MIINHNLGAMNANRNMGINSANANKSMEKLSSGLRINKAGDDAAGLAISEKMRGQIRGLDQASANAADGISMLQTGEGALSETTSILQRMRELATQAASDTNTTDDRKEIQKEINALTSEVNRIGNTTEFNTQKLLDGGEAQRTGAATGTTSTGTGTTASADAQTVGGANAFSFSAGVENVDKGNIDIQFATGTAGAAFSADGKTLTVTLDSTDATISASDVQALIVGADSDVNKPTGLDMTKFTVAADGTDVIDGTGTVTEKVTLAGGTAAATSTTGAFTSEAGVSNGTTGTLGESALDVSTHDNATSAIDILDKAIASVSGERSKLGAYTNRLEHTINNLGTSSENLTSAESRIRDVDMAKEMSTFSKNNILNQAAQAMLAQANQQPQQVLALLR